MDTWLSFQLLKLLKLLKNKIVEKQAFLFVDVKLIPIRQVLSPKYDYGARHQSNTSNFQADKP